MSLQHMTQEGTNTGWGGMGVGVRVECGALQRHTM